VRSASYPGIGATEIGSVVDSLAAAGIEYDALSWREADLETAYLELTGEAPQSTDGIGGVPT
jgi:ABC-2 type transport system ATP-binding protein